MGANRAEVISQKASSQIVLEIELQEEIGCVGIQVLSVLIAQARRLNGLRLRHNGRSYSGHGARCVFRRNANKIINNNNSNNYHLIYKQYPMRGCTLTGGTLALWTPQSA